MKAHVINYLNTVRPLSARLIDDLERLLQQTDLKKKEIFFSAGEVSNRISFIVKGLLRSYHINSKGEEVVNWFMKEGDVTISVKSFYLRVPAEEYIAAIEDSTLLHITHDELQMLYEKYPEFGTIGRLLTEKYYIQSEDRILGMRKLTTMERYELLKETHPDLIKRVPGKYLATYLGMSIRMLTRLRGRF